MRDIADLPVGGDADIAALGALFADPARCSVLLALDDGRALPASVLAEEAGVSRSTASSHLTKLTDAGLLRVETHGRHRYYRLAGPQVGALLEQLVALSPPRPIRSLREGTRAARLRSARTCYDHLAGRLGFELMGSLLDRGVLSGGDGRYELTDRGRDYLTELGVDIRFGRRPVVRYCVDWSEQRHHLGGALGRAILERFLAARWISRVPRGRAVAVTAEGRTALADRFGVDWPGSR